MYVSNNGFRCTCSLQLNDMDQDILIGDGYNGRAHGQRKVRHSVVLQVRCARETNPETRFFFSDPSLR